MKQDHETEEEYEERKIKAAEHAKKLKNGEWIDEHPASDKIVLCVRCLSTYHIRKAPRVMNDKVDIKEPVCPNCKCKIYYS